MPFRAEPLSLSEDEHQELQRMSVSRSLPAGDVFRARLILMVADGRSYTEVQKRLNTTAPTISKWRKRFLEQRLDGLLQERHPGQKPSVITPQLQAKVLAATRRKPSDGSTHWSCRKLAKELGISKDVVHRIWRTAGLRPHRLERYMASNDPDFERKAADAIGLYMNPPQRSAAFCLYEEAVTANDTTELMHERVAVPSGLCRVPRAPSIRSRPRFLFPTSVSQYAPEQAGAPQGCA